jgi:hypothetical protein
MSLSKIVLALVVVAGLAAGTVLVAGYVDKPAAPAPTACQVECDDCPLQGTNACPKAESSGCCAQAKACASPDSDAACEGPRGSCCPQEAPAAPAAESGCGGCPMRGSWPQVQ